MAGQHCRDCTLVREHPRSETVKRCKRQLGMMRCSTRYKIGARLTTVSSTPARNSWKPRPISPTIPQSLPLRSAFGSRICLLASSKIAWAMHRTDRETAGGTQVAKKRRHVRFIGGLPDLDLNLNMVSFLPCDIKKCSLCELQRTASSEKYTNAARKMQQNKGMQDFARHTSQAHEPTESQQQKQKNKHTRGLERAPLIAPLPGSFKVFFHMFSSVQVIIERLNASHNMGGIKITPKPWAW